MAAYGPKALKLCGEAADGFILQLADPQIAAWTIKAVRDAAAAAGRDPESLYICVAAPAYVGDDLAHQRDQVRWFGGMVGNHVADLVERYGADTDLIPEALRRVRRAGRKGYDYAEHGKATSTHVDFVTDDVIDRFCLLGDRSTPTSPASRSCATSASTSSPSTSSTTARTRRSPPTASASSRACGARATVDGPRGAARTGAGCCSRSCAVVLLAGA